MIAVRATVGGRGDVVGELDDPSSFSGSDTLPRVPRITRSGVVGSIDMDCIAVVICSVPSAACGAADVAVFGAMIGDALVLIFARDNEDQ